MNEDAAQQPQAPEQEQSHQVVSSQEKQGMSKFTKIAIVAGAIVIIVIMAELAYVLFNQNTGLLTKRAEQNQASQNFARRFPTPTTSAPASDLQQNKKQVEFERARNFIAELEFINSQNWTEFIEETSTTITYSGRIVSKNTVTGIEEFPYSIVLRSQLGNELGLLYTEEDITNAEFLIEQQDTSRVTSFEEIRTNDIVHITETRNLLDTSTSPDIVFKVIR